MLDMGQALLKLLPRCRKTPVDVELGRVPGPRGHDDLAQGSRRKELEPNSTVRSNMDLRV